MRTDQGNVDKNSVYHDLEKEVETHWKKESLGILTVFDF